MLLDDAAIKAVRANNVEKIKLEEDVPTKGGNIEVYNKQTGQDKTEYCAEYTMC